jgi:hypothetical protein
MVNQLPGDQQQVGVNEIRNKINELILSGATVDVSQFPPSNPGEGDLWFDTTLAEIYIYLGSPTNAWVQASNTSNTSGGSGSSGSTGNTDGNFGVASRYRAAVFKNSSNTWYFTSARTSSGVMVDQATFIGNLYLSDELSMLSSNGDFCVTSTMRAAVFKSSNNTWYFTSSASTTGTIADQATFLGNSHTSANNSNIATNVSGDFCVASRYRAAVFKSSTNTWYFTSARTSSGVMVDQATFIGNLYLSDELSILSASNGDFCVASTMRAAVFKSSNNTWYFTSSASTTGTIADNATFIGDTRTTAENLSISSIHGNFCVTSPFRAAIFKSSNNTWYFTSAASPSGTIADNATFLGNYQTSSKNSTNVN